ncbi:MAG TPA: tagaturonate epimerase family protein [Bryobacteraceae bacterium]|nr:tagaturonate epimerase family protein [Bryobacteraceae bacterium]
MSAIPIELPVKASEAAALADLIFQQLEGRPLNDEVRLRLQGRLGVLGLTSIHPYFGSLQQDPVHSSSYFLAVDAVSGGVRRPLLLRMALSSAPASALFPESILIGRMRPGGGREVVVNAIPFSSTDHANIRKFAEEVDRAFLPRPQAALPAIAAGNRHPEISLPAAFDAFRTISKTLGVNMASTVQLSASREMATAAALEIRDGEDPLAPGHTRVSVDHLYHAGIWAAIRSGWREGYAAEVDHLIVSGSTAEEMNASIAAVRELIDAAAGFAKFTIDTSRLFQIQADVRSVEHWNVNEISEIYQQALEPEDREQLESSFAVPLVVGARTYDFTREEIRRLAVKFGQSLLLTEQLYDFIQSAKAGQKSWKHFDFEPSIDEAETLTTPREMIFYLSWLKARGRPAQLIAPNLGFRRSQPYPESLAELSRYAEYSSWPELLPRVKNEFAGDAVAELSDRLEELAGIARHFNATLSIHHGSGKQAHVIQQIGRTTGGRVNYKISGELQLQLFDVLSEESPRSPWRLLYERMVARCMEFAARGAFPGGAHLPEEKADSYLGDPDRGRTDGNLFLIFWLGYVVGSRDVNCPDGDTRFFKEKLDGLPFDLVKEVRRRNTRYIVWLAENLRS